MIIEHYMLPTGPVVPNNPDLPVIVYRQAVADTDDGAAAFEAAYTRNGWQGIWHNGIYSYHH